MMNERWRNAPDTTDPVGPKFRRAIDIVEQQYDDRRPARGKANTPNRDYRPLENVSREGRQEAYRKWPNAKG